ncbi:HTH domain-containing protein [Lactococcus nasutitermitis]|uniref:HTH domain-containing protein n=1 Tax=Lactococcus nasutitermitis TaxID=1652957 RepID=A0ABV9JBM1_9LACT|nr:HTH domain-containing protein [Lactococcus nasutitermitis]
MKYKNLPALDREIINILAQHKGIERAIRGRDLAQWLNVDLRTLQARIESLQVKGCVIGSVDNVGYFVPVDEAERRQGIIKKQRTGIAINNAVNGYTLADLTWIDELLGGETK